jgi:hypothetical protein
MDNLLHATCFKQALDLARAGRWEEARQTLKGLQDEFIALYDENQALKQQLREVAEVLDLSESMRFDGQKYWLETEDNREGPYCQVCYDQHGKLLRLQEQKRHWQCKGCGNLYLKLEKRKDSEPRQAGSHFPSRLIKNPIPLFVK